jgi:transcriptional regulator with XRE-family HTH domain
MTKGFAYQEIGRRIRELRGNSRQKDWATKIGCDQGYISQVENGVTKPSLAFLKGVASITNASIDWVLTGNGDRYGCNKPVEFDGEEAKDTLGVLQDNPKLLMAIDRLLRTSDKGFKVLEALGDMEESRFEGLVGFLAGSRV